MLWKCCTQYVSKFGKLSSGRCTGKGQFSFQSQRKAMPKNIQITAQLNFISHSSKVMLKIVQPGFNNMWTVNVQIFKLYLEKAEIKLPTSIGLSKEQESSRKTYFSFIDYAKAFEYVDHNKLWKILKEVGIQDHLTCLLRNQYTGQESTVRTGHGITDWFKAVYCHPAYLTSMQSASCKTPHQMKHKLESRLLGEISITSDVQVTPPLW